jgi:hypothetical protein
VRRPAPRLTRYSLISYLKSYNLYIDREIVHSRQVSTKSCYIYRTLLGIPTRNTVGIPMCSTSRSELMSELQLYDPIRARVNLNACPVGGAHTPYNVHPASIQTWGSIGFSWILD